MSVETKVTLKKRSPPNHQSKKKETQFTAFLKINTGGHAKEKKKKKNGSLRLQEEGRGSSITP